MYKLVMKKITGVIDFTKKEFIVTVVLFSFLIILVCVKMISSGDWIVSSPEIKEAEVPDIPYIININSADQGELMLLSKIGKAKAMAIVKYRNENGNFNSIDELKNVQGVGDAILNSIKDHVVFGHKIGSNDGTR